jgi:hypothetical protein
MPRGVGSPKSRAFLLNPTLLQPSFEIIEAADIFHGEVGRDRFETARRPEQSTFRFENQRQVFWLQCVVAVDG